MTTVRIGRSLNLGVLIANALAREERVLLVEGEEERDLQALLSAAVARGEPTVLLEDLSSFKLHVPEGIVLDSTMLESILPRTDNLPAPILFSDCRPDESPLRQFSDRLHDTASPPDLAAQLLGSSSRGLEEWGLESFGVHEDRTPRHRIRGLGCRTEAADATERKQAKRKAEKRARKKQRGSR